MSGVGKNASAISVRVPATSANLGPGFDCLGLALDVYNTFTLHLNRPFRIDVVGESADGLPRTRENVVVTSIYRVLSEAGVVETDVPSFSLSLDNEIPVSSGLGSSASAIVGGLVLANGLLELYSPDRVLSEERLLELATELEGHPDNVAPALLGGGVLAFHDKVGLRTTTIPIPESLRFVAATPNFSLATEEARKVLPQHYARREVVENMAQCARLMLALAKPDLDLLRGGLTDAVHEPYRKPLVPGAHEVERAAMEMGAYAVTLSGAGPSLLAWCRPDVAVAVADEMTLAWLSVGIPCKTLVLQATTRATKPVYGGA